MPTSALCYQIPLEDLIDQIFSSRTITRAEEDLLSAALASTRSLSDDQKAAIQRVFYGLRHGLLRVVA